MTHQSSSSLAWHAQVSCSWWHIHSRRMHMAGVLYQALWEPVFTPSSGEHLSTVLRCWCSLLAWQEVVILSPYRFPNCACNCVISHLCDLVLNYWKERCTECEDVIQMLYVSYFCCIEQCTVYFNVNFRKKIIQKAGKGKMAWSTAVEGKGQCRVSGVFEIAYDANTTENTLVFTFLSNDSSKTLLPS